MKISRRSLLTGAAAAAFFPSLAEGQSLGPIGIALANEVAALQAQQFTSGPNAGCVTTYFNTLTTNDASVDPYSPSIGLRYALTAYRLSGQAAPTGLITMAAKFLTWQLGRIMWTLTTAGSGGTDSGGATYSAGAQLITMRDGTFYAIPTGYRSPAGQTGSVTSYTTAQQALVASTVQSMFKKGLPFYSFLQNTTLTALPGWWLHLPFMAITPPLSSLADQNPSYYTDFHNGWYDSSDSFPASIVALAGEYLKTQSNASFTAWLQANWQTLVAISAASIALPDPQTNLQFAVPYSTAEYTEDNTEVWKGLYEMSQIIARADTLNLGLFSSNFSGASTTPYGEKDAINLNLSAIKAAIARFLQVHRVNPAGYAPPGGFVPCWNGTLNVVCNENSPTLQAYLGPFALAFTNDIPYGIMETGWSSDSVQASYFAAMASQGLPAITTSGAPNSWNYLGAANAIGSPGAPFTLAQFETWVASINSTIFVGYNRQFPSWWTLESGSFIWLCLILLSNGAT